MWGFCPHILGLFGLYTEGDSEPMQPAGFEPANKQSTQHLVMLTSLCGFQTLGTL